MHYNKTSFTENSYNNKSNNIDHNAYMDISRKNEF